MQSLYLSLCNENAIEGIAMVSGQQGELECVLVCDREQGGRYLTESSA